MKLFNRKISKRDLKKYIWLFIYGLVTLSMVAFTLAPWVGSW